jgi:hypothetical protein
MRKWIKVIPIVMLSFIVTGAALKIAHIADSWNGIIMYVGIGFFFVYLALIKMNPKVIT